MEFITSLGKKIHIIFTKLFVLNEKDFSLNLRKKVIFYFSFKKKKVLAFEMKVHQEEKRFMFNTYPDSNKSSW